MSQKPLIKAAAFSSVLLLIALPVNAKPGDPNGAKNQPETGWSLWQRWDKIKTADFEIGLSHIDLGGMMEFENACFGEVGAPDAEKRKSQTYWFRVSNDVDRYGIGTVEVGCWQDDKFKLTQSVTALKNGLTFSDVYCRKVRVQKDDGLVIRAEADANSRVVGRVKNGQTVEISKVPPETKIQDGRSWIKVNSPIEGWVSNGMLGSKGNLQFCKEF
ncbi:SH3 domain-containing protein [Aerosakkonemataceae cyanobacterium BLCC-F50]|uniref:SH3 domain-containing protein n=1 Tax=Floridaenema flaviceps BLCC-F50 TaxID=3153642 RepID=A0ABV4XZD7_9CYAN